MTTRLEQGRSILLRQGYGGREPRPCVRFAIVAVMLAFGATARAQVPACDALTGEPRAQAMHLLDTLAPYDCCDLSLAECLKAPAPSRLVKRLASDVCRRLGAGQKPDDAKRELEKRAASMPPVAKPADLDLGQVAWAGDPAAPVSVVVFACARCPFCSKSVPALYTAVTTGSLKGRARLAVKLFPVRTHPFAAEAATAVEAARALGVFWPYVLEVYGRFDDFSVAQLSVYAKAVGLDPVAFEAEQARPATRERVVATKKEGVRLGVEATPTVFLQGRRYRGDVEEAALLDAIEEEIERAAGTVCVP